MMFTAALVVLLQLPLPSVPLPSGFPGGANLERLALDLSGVVKGEMPDVPPVSFPLTGFGLPQTAPPVIAPGETGQLEWSYVVDPNRPVKFRLWVDGVIVKNFATADLTESGTTPRIYTTNPGVLAPFTAAQIGPHTLALTAYDASGESARAELAVMMGFTTPPLPPSGVKYKIVGTGTSGPDGALVLSVTLTPEIVK